MSLRLEKMRSAPTEGLFGAVVAISAGAAFLLLPALINGFPFVFPDFFHLNHLLPAIRSARRSMTVLQIPTGATGANHPALVGSQTDFFGTVRPSGNSVASRECETRR